MINARTPEQLRTFYGRKFRTLRAGMLARDLDEVDTYILEQMQAGENASRVATVLGKGDLSCCERGSGLLCRLFGSTKIARKKVYASWR